MINVKTLKKFRIGIIRLYRELKAKRHFKEAEEYKKKNCEGSLMGGAYSYHLANYFALIRKGTNCKLGVKKET